MKIKRYLKILFRIFDEFGIGGGARIIYFFCTNNLYKNRTEKILTSVWCKSLEKRIYVRKGTTDIVLLILMFCVECDNMKRREYEIDLGNRDVKYIIDAGANVGFFSLQYAKRYPEAKIVVIEPDEDNYKVLNMNIQDNKNIIAVKCGLWSKKTYLNIVDRNTGSWGFNVCESENGTESSLKSITIGDILEEYQFERIDILKLDIEGAEYEVLGDNCSEWIEKAGVIFIETHDKIISGCDEMVTDVMNRYGFGEQPRNGENRVFFQKNMKYERKL